MRDPSDNILSISANVDSMMAHAEYDWTRIWKPIAEQADEDTTAPTTEKQQEIYGIDIEALMGRTVEVDADAGGSNSLETDLQSPAAEHELGRRIHPLAEYADLNVLILLGAAGAGKTYELERYEAALRTAGETVERLRVRAVSNGYELADRLLTYVEDGLESGRAAYLLVDGLDESSDPRVLDRLATQLAKMPEEKRQLIRLRLTSRSSYYSASLSLRSDIDRIRSLFDPSSSLRLEIQPLAEEQIKRAAVIRRVDEHQAFLEKVKERRVFPLAQTPGSLNLLLDLYESQGDLPATRMEVYDRGLRLQLSTSERENQLAWSQDELMDGVGAVAALLLLSGKTFVQANPSSATSSDVAIPLHEIRQLRSLRSLSDADLAKFFHTGVFEGALGSTHVDGLIEIRSREYAEFLAGRFLASRAEEASFDSSSQDLLVLLSVSQDPKRGVNPALFGVAGWAATFNPDVLFDHLVATDPDILLHGDPDVLSGDQKQRLLEVLIAEVEDRRLHAFDLYTSGLSGLRQPGLEDQIRPLLETRDSASLPSVVFGLYMVAAMKAESSVPEAIAIAVDRSMPLHVRLVALSALEEIPAAADSLAELKILLSDDDGDPFFSLRAAVARLLFPAVISADELLSSMSFPTEEDPIYGVDFSFGFYLTHELPPLLDAEALGSAFRTTSRLQPKNHGIRDIVPDFVDSLLCRAIELAGPERALEIEGFTHHLHAWLSKRRYSPRGRFAQVWRSLPELRSLALQLLATAEESPVGFVNLFWSDKEAIAEKLPSLTGQERSFFIELLWALTQNVEGTSLRLRLLSDPDFKAYAAERCVLPSECSVEDVAKEIQAISASWKALDDDQNAPDADPKNPVEERAEIDPNPIVEGCSDWERIWDKMHRSSWSSNADWTAFPGWDRLTEANRERAVSLAQTYLTDGSPGAEWSGYWRDRGMGEVNSAHAALRLLCDCGQCPDKARWLPTLVALALTSTKSEAVWRENALMAWAADSGAAREAAIRVTLEHDGVRRTNLSALVKFARHDTELVTELGRTIVDKDTPPEAAALAARAVLEADFNSASSSLATVMKDDNDIRRVAAVAIAILELDEDLPELWQRLDTDLEVGKAVVARLAGRIFRGSEGRVNVTPDQRRRLLSIAAKTFPASSLPERPLSGSYRPTVIDDVLTWLGEQASVLVDEGEYEIVEKFVEEHPRYGYLARRAWISWRSKIASNTSVPTTDLIEQLNHLKLRQVSTPFDLMWVVVESLERYQHWLDSGAVFDLWNEVRPSHRGQSRQDPDIIVPRQEEQVSDHLARFLYVDLRQTIIRREVRTPKLGRTDIEVTVKGKTSREIRTIVEVKCSYHRRATDVQTELIDRYLGDNDATGVHVVFDFWSPAWYEQDKRSKRSKTMSGKTLEENLREALTSVSERHRVEAVVVRATYPKTQL